MVRFPARSAQLPLPDISVNVLPSFRMPAFLRFSTTPDSTLAPWVRFSAAVPAARLPISRFSTPPSSTRVLLKVAAVVAEAFPCTVNDFPSPSTKVFPSVRLAPAAKTTSPCTVAVVIFKVPCRALTSPSTACAPLKVWLPVPVFTMLSACSAVFSATPIVPLNV